MRLIDKEKFNERLDFLLYELNFYANKDMPGFNDERTRTIGTFFITHIHNMLNRTTEVDAVPMEWIKKYIDSTLDEGNSQMLGFKAAIIKEMVEEWEKENEMR